MRSETVYYVLPVGEAWIVRALGGTAQRFLSLEEALEAAEVLTARGQNVRVLSRPLATPVGLPS